jgi:hypothetical protein
MARLPEMRIENARILFRNFKGEERRDPKTNKIVNEAGCRNFCVQIEESDAEILKSNGWNVKHTKPSDEYDGVLYYIPVEVRFDNFPPSIDMFTKHNRTRLTEDTVELLDPPCVIKSADIIINPSAWEVNGRTGIKAYCSKAYIVVEEDDWEEKYAGWGGPEE